MHIFSWNNFVIKISKIPRFQIWWKRKYPLYKMGGIQKIEKYIIRWSTRRDGYLLKWLWIVHAFELRLVTLVTYPCYMLLKQTPVKSHKKCILQSAFNWSRFVWLTLILHTCGDKYICWFWLINMNSWENNYLLVF